jgi:hypothetical protein
MDSDPLGVNQCIILYLSYCSPVGKLNLADAKFREYSSKFSFSPYKKKKLKKKIPQIIRIIILPILPPDYGSLH